MERKTEFINKYPEGVDFTFSVETLIILLNKNKGIFLYF